MKLRILFGLFFITTGAMSCGEKNSAPISKAPAMPRIGTATPTLESFEDWKSIWDGTSWIVAWKTTPGIKPTKSALKSLLVHKFIPSGVFSNALSNDLANAVSLDFLSSDIAGNKENISGFSVIKFKTMAPVWPSLFPQLPWHEPILGLPSRALANFMWNSLERIPNVAWVEPNLQSTLAEYTLPPEFDSNGQPKLRRIRADVAWEKVVDANGTPRYTYGGSTSLTWTNVAVIDTGVDFKHTDLYSEDYETSHIFQNPREQANGIDDDGNGYVDDIYGIDATIEMDEWNAQVRDMSTAGTPGQPVPGAADLNGAGQPCPDTAKKCGHGTHVAGIIAAKPGDSSSSTVGVCPSCRIVSIRAARQLNAAGDSVASGGVEDGPIDDAAQIRGVAYIMSLKNESGDPYVRIVNMSLGKYFISRTLAYWFRRLLENDILVVAAAGNDDSDTPSFPAAYDPVLSVCATSEDSASGSGGRGAYAKTSFSNFGAWVDICAPGLQVTSTFPGSKTYVESGTSQATPFVAGAAAYLKSLNPTMSGADIANRLMKYSNAVNLYHGATTTNSMNRLYEGWFPDGTQYFLLGTGFLDLGSAATEGKSCWSPDAKTPEDCISYAFANRKLGYLSQMNGGCVIGSLAGSGHPLANAMASMPFVMLQVGALFTLAKRMRKRARDK